jgi:hypothetical protein
MVVPKMGRKEWHQGNAQQNTGKWNAPHSGQLSAIEICSKGSTRGTQAS